MSEERLDEIRGKALDKVARSEMFTNGFFWAGAVFELALGLTFLLLLDYSDPLHIVLLFAVGTIYVPLVLFVFSVSMQLDRHAEKILKALELREQNGGESAAHSASSS